MNGTATEPETGVGVGTCGSGDGHCNGRLAVGGGGPVGAVVLAESTVIKAEKGPARISKMDWARAVASSRCSAWRIVKSELGYRLNIIGMTSDSRLAAKMTSIRLRPPAGAARPQTRHANSLSHLECRLFKVSTRLGGTPRGEASAVYGGPQPSRPEGRDGLLDGRVVNVLVRAVRMVCGKM